MKKLIAIIHSGSDLSKEAKFVNNHRNDGSYFYVYGNRITISNPFKELTENEQLASLNWFLDARSYSIEKQ